MQIVWNSKMREEVLELMEAAREHPEAAGTPLDFTFKALQVEYPPSHTVSCSIAGILAVSDPPRCLRSPSGI